MNEHGELLVEDSKKVSDTLSHVTDAILSSLSIPKRVFCGEDGTMTGISPLRGAYAVMKSFDDVEKVRRGRLA